MQHGSYWVLKHGVFADEELDSGYQDEAAAQRCAEQLSALGHIVTVQHLETIEHDLPIESPKYREADAFSARRWCVIVQKTNEAAGEGG